MQFGSVIKFERKAKEQYAQMRRSLRGILMKMKKVRYANSIISCNEKKKNLIKIMEISINDQL